MLNCSWNNSVEVLDIFNGDMYKVMILSFDLVINSLCLLNESFWSVRNGSVCMFNKLFLLRRLFEIFLNYNGVFFLNKLKRCLLEIKLSESCCVFLKGLVWRMLSS